MTTAAMGLTMLPVQMVRRALTQPRGTADLNVLPSRISSLMRSEADDERVGGHTDTDDEAGDTGQVEGEPDPPAQQHDDAVHPQTGQDQ